MLSDVRNYYGLAKDFRQAGYFETEHSEQIVRELKLEIKVGNDLRRPSMEEIGSRATIFELEGLGARNESISNGY
jgi:hypothetical protein